MDFTKTLEKLEQAFGVKLSLHTDANDTFYIKDDRHHFSFCGDTTPVEAGGTYCIMFTYRNNGKLFRMQYDYIIDLDKFYDEVINFYNYAIQVSI